MSGVKLETVQCVKDLGVTIALNLKFSQHCKGERVQCIKELGVTIASNLKFSQHCKDTADKANEMLGLIKIFFSFNNKDITLPLYISLIRPHMDYAD